MNNTHSQISDVSNYVIDKRNRRLVIHKYPLANSLESLIQSWIALAQAEGLEKLWLWGYPKDLVKLQKYGFVLEGEFPYLDNQIPCFSLAYYLSPRRSLSLSTEEEDKLIQEISAKPVRPLHPLPKNVTISQLSLSDAAMISRILVRVFQTYPTPVDNPLYIQKLMQSGSIFAGAFFQDKLVSIASAYPEEDFGRCEMTDCATLPDFRGYGLTERILGLLEYTILKSYTPYSLARARSYGMNRVFYKLGYTYKGRLINNCNIDGGFEDMNLWVKRKA